MHSREIDIQHVGLEERTGSKQCHHREPDLEYNTLKNSLGNPVSCWVKRQTQWQAESRGARFPQDQQHAAQAVGASAFTVS